MDQLQADELRNHWVNSPFTQWYKEKGNKAYQATVAYLKMKNGDASKMAKKAAPSISKRMKNRTKQQVLKASKAGGKSMQDNLRANPEKKKLHYSVTGTSIKNWNENNPELKQQRVSNAAKGLAKWREENPELAKQQIAMANEAAVKVIKEKESWRKAQGISQELALWKKGLDLAHEKIRSEEYKQSPEGKRTRKKASNRMKDQRKNPEFNKKMKEALNNSEAKKRSQLENIKKASAVAHSKIVCPHCQKEGPRTLWIGRYHFDKCKFKVV